MPLPTQKMVRSKVGIKITYNNELGQHAMKRPRLFPPWGEGERGRGIWGI
jgi:hypothetical protein